MRRVLYQVVMTSLCVVAMSWAQDRTKWIQPKQDGVGVYRNEIRQLYEQPVATVGITERLEVTGSGRDHYKVKFNNQSAWVEKRLVQAVARGSKSYVFDDQEVIGYLDNPTPVYIIDSDDRERDPIKLDRSFAEALRENTDRETVEREAK